MSKVSISSLAFMLIARRKGNKYKHMEIQIITYIFRKVNKQGLKHLHMPDWKILDFCQHFEIW